MRIAAPALVLIGCAACVAAAAIRVRLGSADGGVRHALADLFGHRTEIERWHGWALGCLAFGTALIAIGALLAVVQRVDAHSRRRARRARAPAAKRRTPSG